jgi:hypothetical protein
MEYIGFKHQFDKHNSNFALLLVMRAALAFYCTETILSKPKGLVGMVPAFSSGVGIPNFAMRMKDQMKLKRL